MAWRLAKSLATLRAQVNALAPKRSKASDGTIGDAKHSARKSDHNPDASGVVRAIDFTNDPAGGMDAQKLADALVAARDPRIKYIISRGRIINGTGGKSPWVWRKYTGSNKHDKHVHLSVKAGNAGDADGKWNLAAFGKAVEPAKPIEKPTPIAKMALSRGDRGDLVKELQRDLNGLGFGPLVEDGVFGEGTETAVKAFQAAHKGEDGKPLVVDGKAGSRTSKAIAAAKLAPKIEEAKKSVPETADKAVKEETGWWSKVTGFFTGGGLLSVLGLGSWGELEWTEILALMAGVAGLGVVAVLLFLWLGRRVMAQFDAINERAKT